MQPLTFTLKQHTPLIHFQKEQTGAFLRATEIKPKLDRFLLSECRDEIPPACIRDTEKGSSLFLRLTITTGGWGSRPIPDNTKLYFGGLGTTKENKNPIVEATTTQLHIHCYNKQLRELISRKMDKFLLTHNFGSRQSKGFGSFTLEQPDYALLAASGYSFDIKTGWVGNNRPLEELEKFTLLLDMFHRSLRSGLNYNYKNGSGFYMKPFIWQYFRQQPGGVKWEKKKIKEEFFGNDLSMQVEKHRNVEFPVAHGSTNELLIKDLLGLSTNEQWKGYPAGKTSNLTKEHNHIKRFPSPFLFKPVKTGAGSYKVYILLRNDDFINAMLGESFRIASSSGKKNIDIKTPEKFSLAGFFDFVYARKDEAQLRTMSAKHDTAEFEYIKNMYKTLVKL